MRSLSLLLLFGLCLPSWGQGKRQFTDVTAESGLKVADNTGVGGDGHLDLYVASLRKGASRLYRNKGDGTFEDVTLKAGVGVPEARSCAWSDVDGDGRPDLFVTNPKGGCYLFRNKGDGTFEDIAKTAGVELVGRHCLG